MQRYWPSHWLLDALVTTWIATGISAFVLLPIGAILTSGSVFAMLTTDNAWVGVAAAPWVSGFVLVGTAIGAWFNSRCLRWVLGLLPLIGFSVLLISWDYTSDLGEGNQVVTAFGVGLLIAGVCASPAFFVNRREFRILLMLLPPSVIGAVATAFITAG